MSASIWTSAFHFIPASVLPLALILISELVLKAKPEVGPAEPGPAAPPKAAFSTSWVDPPAVNSMSPLIVIFGLAAYAAPVINSDAPTSAVVPKSNLFIVINLQ